MAKHRRRCPECGKLFKRLALHTYYAHMGVKRTHLPPKRLQRAARALVTGNLVDNRTCPVCDHTTFPTRQGFLGHMRLRHGLTTLTVASLQGGLRWNKADVVAAIEHEAKHERMKRDWNLATDMAINPIVQDMLKDKPVLVPKAPLPHPLGWDKAETSVEDDGRQAMLNAAHAVLVTPEPGKEYPLMMGEFINKDTIRDMDTGLLYVAVSAIVYMAKRVPSTWKLD